MIIHSFRLLSDNLRMRPKLFFRGKNIENLDQFSRGGISVSWTGDPEVVDNGIKTVPGTYGMFNYDMSGWQEFTMCYTFKIHAKADWRGFLNLAWGRSTVGMRIENGSGDRARETYLWGINNDDTAIVSIVGGPPGFVTDVDKIYNLIVVVSKTEPVKIYVNGNQTHELIQPDDKKGFNGNGHANIDTHAFNRRLSANRSEDNVTHYDLRVWNKALTYEQIMQEVLADAKDYGIDITIHRSVVNKFRVNEYKVGE